MPYRDADVLLPCPRCASSLARDDAGKRMTCLDGCGDLITPQGLQEMLGDAVRFARTSSMWWKSKATECPVCKVAMHALMAGDAEIYRCAEHGVWLDRGSSPLADQVAALQRSALSAAEEAKATFDRQVLRLVDGLVRKDASIALEVIRRLLDAERRIAELEAQLAHPSRR
jgi:Zn-finger nucleic acid-binding protein